MLKKAAIQKAHYEKGQLQSNIFTLSKKQNQ